MQKERTKKRTAFFLFLGASFLLILVCNLLTPMLSDDYAYGVVARRAHSLGDLFLQEADHYLTWNGRSVAHFLLRLTLIAPPVLFKILNSLVFVLLSLLMYLSVSGHRAYDIRLLAFITLSLWFGGISFAETILWQTGSCNYLWGTAIILGFLVLFKHLLSAENGAGQSVRQVGWAIGLFLFGLIAGWCNENTSGGGLLLSLGILFQYRREGQDRRISPWMLAGPVGQLTGLILMVAAPGNRIRASLQEPEIFSGPVGLFARFQKISLALEEHLFLWIALFLFLLVLGITQKKRIAPFAEQIFLFAVFAATSYALVLSPPTQIRAHFGAGVFLLIAIAGLYDRVSEEETLISALKNSAVLIAAVWFCFYYLDNVTDLGRIWRESAERTAYIEGQLAESDTDTIVVPMLRPGFETDLSCAYSVDLTEDPGFWANNIMANYYGVNEIIALPREEWEEAVSKAAPVK
ncbi:MAG: DUF6056 family protein [Lachnospiraceae bacterium]|nr:DUF6056 family protein [Lachnospiraceae bacterium]